MGVLARGTSVLACVLAIVATALVWPATAAASGTPRAQFWDEVNFQGHKLDKDVSFDVPGGQQQQVPDLSKEGLSCWFCDGNWDNRIVSLSTTGGGQDPVNLVAFNLTNYDEKGGWCLLVRKGVQIRDLTRPIPVRGGPGNVSEWVFDRTMSSFVVLTKETDVPPQCFIYNGPDFF
ncbi:hypothetical protein OG874_01485 [Nocardia sp. NBC_00565]|uniref:hypothetical protein n=1 Tax=Nocardia sp. NBC_00565 TaxID=2975993 RepID=UPI002E80C2EB|nr:hypothetical protein [Nocardia sp. NBC_00565]WUC03918.1 hypothetical protein OG874_01485 [Nocardia sp. NBC_00565]